MQLATRVRASLASPFTPVVFFFAGVGYDTVTLTRIDRLLDNVIILVYLIVLGILIVLTGRAAMGDPRAIGDPASPSRLPRLMAKARPFYPNAMQFLLGGLFSAYTIFYLQSASSGTTAIFFAVLVSFLVANEFLKDRLTGMKLLSSLYTLVCFSFFTYFIPVLTGFMNTFVFLFGAVLSLAVALGVLKLVYAAAPDRSRAEKTLAGAPSVLLVGLLVVLYFLNWIPPVPLSLKFGGVYHQVTKPDDQYRLSFESPPWYMFWKNSDDPYRGDGPVYCFTAVFAPVALETTIYHHWQLQGRGPEGEAVYRTTDRIAIDISGGREAGYRAYTYKARALPGDWRVDVETERGRLIGRVNFTVHAPGPNGRELKTLTY